MILRAPLLSFALTLSALFWSEAALAQTETSRLRGLETENAARVWQAVGRLDTGGGYCTATLIAPDLLLTAAHCLFDRAGNPVAHENLTFQAGLTAGQAAARVSIAQVEIASGYAPKSGMTQQNVRNDLALLRLDKPISTFDIAPFGVFEGTLPPGPVSVVSYGRGRSANLSRQDRCQVLEVQSDILTMDCDVTFGSSGAPVFTHLNGRGQIVSVMSGIGRYGGEQYAFGMTLPRLISTLKSKMYANRSRPAARIRRIETGEGRTGSGAKFVTAKGS